ncbi:MAG: TIGR04190 family B12-binding domain/radical SAM domain protein [Candidatus Zixiibacteriota bacterium]
MTDLILLHPPSIYDFRKRSIMWGPISDVIPSTPIFEMYPLGFVSISQYLNRHGFDVRIINVAYRMLSDPDYDAEKQIKNLRTFAFGIDLHWLPHAQGSLELAKIVKKYHPHTPVIFGGLSSTYFHEELITYPQVDFVLRGDSTEVPLLALLSALKNGKGLGDIPNLTYRENGTIKINPTSWVPDDINSFTLDYPHIIRSVIKYRDLSGFVPFYGWQEYPITAIFTCRGCSYHCGTCGGSQDTYNAFSRRQKPAYRKPELVVTDILSISRYFKGPVFILGDIFQPGVEYAQKLLSLIKKTKVDNHIVLEFFDIPPLDYLDVMADSIPHLNIQFSPETHDPQIRNAFGRPYDNQRMEEMIERILGRGCNKLDLFFMVGIPRQDSESVMQTVDYVDYLLERFGKTKKLFPYISPLAPFLDPGSLVFENPEKYGYKLFYRTLEEHRKALLQPGWKQMLNYETKWMSRDQIVENTYSSALKLNRIKFKHRLIKDKKFKEIERRIGQAQSIIQAIDEQIERGKSTIDWSNPESLQLSTICDKDELKWPVRVLKFNVRSSSLKMLSLLRIKNILGLILWGGLRSKSSADRSPQSAAKT